MPLIINKKLPAYKALKKESVFEISPERASKQDIRPLEIGILNLMPSAVVERTELQLLRFLSNTPLQIHPTFIYFDEHKSKSKQGHFDTFYKPFKEVRSQGLDGLIVTGANLEEYDFEDVHYWKELGPFLDWAGKSVTSTIFSCWAVHASLYRSYGLRARTYKKKQFGIFQHTVHHGSNSPFILGMDDVTFIPHSRWRGVERKDIAPHKELEILISSEEVGPHLIVGRKGRELYIQGHPEYDRGDIAEEYFRDKEKGVRINKPKNYFPGDDEKRTPLKTWAANGQVFYANWINWVYQTTNFDVKKPLMD
ncbi:MAG: homoserine O-succinyltransferase [Parcubacteria group bacterium Gr01-1014_8]|nr:MAG: homoserine O-succinyltransferase [Parcubacteria group bacterium Gr01-1014_8]